MSLVGFPGSCSHTAAMAPHGSRRRHRRRSRRELTPEEQALRDARRRANARVRFLRHLFLYAAVCTGLFLIARPAALAVAFFWGIGIASHYFGAVVAPPRREQIFERELAEQVAIGVSAERRSLADRHVRQLEDLSAQVAHEIRNPITAAKSLVQQMGEDPRSPGNVEYAKVALEELDRVERSVAHLLRFAREEDLRLSAVRIDEVVASALETLRERVASAGVRLRTEIDTDAVLRADPEQLRRVLINLAANALDALAESDVPDPVLEVAAGENLAGTECWVRVRDNGPGIASDALARIWSPFYTSKPGGTGLGLAIAKKVVDAHGGSLEARSEPGGGSEFTVTLPKAPGTVS